MWYTDTMNIRQVAEKAGVSVATVSRVMNHPESVAPETKKKIEAVIEEMGYTPNWFARGLNFNKTGTIGIMIPNVLNPAHMEVAKGAEDVAHQKDYTTFMCNVENDVEKEKKYVSDLIKRKVDGIVLISSLLENDYLESILKQGVPLVSVGENKTASTDIPVVRLDYRLAAYKAAKHLLEIGYRNIAMIYGSTPEKENIRKIEGYQDALKEFGAPIYNEYMLSAENTIEDGYVSGKKMIEMKNRPRAIFATSDILALGIMDAMRDNEIRIPDDMAVVGFDNIRMSNLITPKLTTVEKPMHKMGVIGARVLFDLIESEEYKNGQAIEPPKEILLQSKLKIRKSCGHKDRIGEMF